MEAPVTAFFPAEFKSNHCRGCGLSYISAHVPIGDNGPTEPYMALVCPRCGRTVIFDTRLEGVYFEKTLLPLLPADYREQYLQTGAWERARLMWAIWLDNLEPCQCGTPFRVALSATTCPKCGQTSTDATVVRDTVPLIDSTAGIRPNDAVGDFDTYSRKTENGRQMRSRMLRALGRAGQGAAGNIRDNA